MVAGLADLARAAQLLADRDEVSLLRRIRWLPPQDEFLRTVDVRPVLLRTGNQWLGKSTVGAADTLYRCQGDHPHDPRGRVTPCSALVVSPTDQHSIGLQEKIWDLADKSTLAAGQAFVAGKGMRGRHPILRFANGSRITFRTAQQGGLALSGGTYDHLLIDELIPHGIYGELKARIARRNGTIRLTLTPINAPADWLREECEAGRVVDLHYRCEARWCIPVGASEPITDRTGIAQDQAWIDRYIGSMDPREVEVRAHGGWLLEHADRSFAAWSDDLVLHDGDHLPDLVDLAVGIDYGEDPGRWVVLLMARAIDGSTYVLGEWAGSGRDSIEDAVRGIEGMLAGWSLTPSSVPRWVGDVNSAGPLSGGRSMNDVLTGALRRAGHRVELATAWKPRGSVDARFSLLNGAMARRRLRVHASCRRLLEAVRGHRRGAQAAGRLKDPVDALWYGCEPWIRESLVVPVRVAVR